jgi:hypothetical protein
VYLEVVSVLLLFVLDLLGENRLVNHSRLPLNFDFGKSKVMGEALVSSEAVVTVSSATTSGLGIFTLNTQSNWAPTLTHCSSAAVDSDSDADADLTFNKSWELKLGPSVSIKIKISSVVKLSYLLPASVQAPDRKTDFYLIGTYVVGNSDF